ncbi:MAG: hypothetical protein U1U88_000266 [Lawsonella clevelandensis]
MTVETAITPELRKSRISAACAFGVHAMLLVASVAYLSAEPRSASSGLNSAMSRTSFSLSPLSLQWVLPS